MFARPACIPTYMHVFLVEKSWIETMYDDRKDFNRIDGEFEVVPVVLDGTIRNVYNYACRSSRRTPATARGTGAIALRATRATPYLDDGCTDINECLHPKEYGCYGNCMNTPGGYTCVCPPGTSGNPTEMNGCHSKDKFTFVKSSGGG
ncbi:hypothetical protein EE612_037384 [Oryza sativa]|nr:hypothetical protein EE612_037384 [Oryza sativa]